MRDVWVAADVAAGRSHSPDHRVAYPATTPLDYILYVHNIRLRHGLYPVYLDLLLACAVRSRIPSSLAQCREHTDPNGDLEVSLNSDV